RLARECERLEREHQPPQTSQATTIPSVVDLVHETESFLYEVKNFFRDLTGVINAAYATRFDHASQFYASRNGIPQWAADQFGTEDRLTKFLTSHQGWISDLARMRNAVEHPNGRDGVLDIMDYQMVSNHEILRPTWQRTGNRLGFIVSDMGVLCNE